MSLPPLDRLAGFGVSTVVADIGAADFADSRAYALMFPTGWVCAFEPFPPKGATYPPDGVTWSCFALGDADGQCTFHRSGGTYGGRRDWPYSGSLLAPTGHLDEFPAITFTADVVEVRRFDTLAHSWEGLNEVSLVHVDVQGAELAVLRGFGRHLQFVRGVWLEVGEGLYEGQPSPAEVAAALTAWGFRLDYQEPQGKREANQLWLR